MIQSLAAASLVDVLVVAAVRHKEKKKINQSYFIPVKGYSHLCPQHSEPLVQSIGPEEQAQDISIIDIAHIPRIPERNQAAFC